jgi:hypothetical protein
MGVAAIAIASGCAHAPGLSTEASITTRSVGANPAELQTTFATVYTTPSRVNDGTIIATTVSAEALLNGTATDGEVLHIEVLWHPSAGETPLSADATNLSIRYVIISGSEVGVYEGGGFGWPSGSADSGYSVVIDGATLNLARSTDGFVDLLSPAQINGTVAGRVDEHGARTLKWAVQEFLGLALPEQ